MSKSLQLRHRRDQYVQYIVLVLATILIVASSIVLWNFYNQTSEDFKRTALKEISGLAETVTKYRNFYTTKILPKAREGGVLITHDYKDTDGALPLPATFIKDFSQFISDKDQYLNVTLFSEFPFPWRESEELDDFQQWALKSLEKNPSEPVWRIEEKDGVKTLRYATPDVMKEACVECHNTFGGTPKRDWKVGDVRGALEVSRPLSAFGTETQNTLKDSFIMMVGVLVAMTMMFILLLRRLYTAINNASAVNAELVSEMDERSKVTRALERAELKSRTIVNTVQEVIVVIDSRGRITEINAAVASVFGYKPDELVGLNVSTLMPSDHAMAHDGYIAGYMKTGARNIMKRPRELFARHRNGDVFSVELTVNEARVKDEVFFVGTMRDITHRLRAEKQIAEAHQAALESARLKSEFLANMSHEIRTPMNGVIGMSDMLMQSPLNDEQRELTRIVKDSAESLLVIINDILDFSKIEAGKLTVKKEEIQLVYVLESVFELLNEHALRKDVNLALFIDRDVPQHIMADSGRLRQILINLLNNALKFTEHGHVILQVTRSDDEFIKFEVIDTGIGIPEAACKRLFDAFSQVDGSSTREHGGTGLGLAICKQLVELMGGEINVISAPGEGSTFWFNLPAERMASDTPYISADMKVLMFSNDGLMNRYYQRQMEQWGMRPTVTSNMDRLLELMQQNDYDMLAFDADVTHTDPDHPMGIHTMLEELRKYTRVPIILYASAARYERLLDEEMGKNIELMAKPVKHSMVQMLIRQMHMASKMKHARGEKQLPAPEEKKPAVSKPAKKTARPKAIEQLPSNGFRILLAEDNRVNQKVAEFMLKKAGYEVEIANNGQEALEKIENDRYDLIFMDCQMPEVDGYEATRRIRALPDDHHSHKIPIVALTAHAMKSNDQQCYDAGMDDYLTKPVRSPEMQAVLDKWRSQMQAMSDARAKRSEGQQEVVS